MSRERPRVVIVDRPSWYEPVVEREELARAAAEVIVGWAEVSDRPPQADHGYPLGDYTREALSRVTAALVPPAVTTPARVIAMAQDAEAVFAVRADVNAGVMDALPRLRVIGRYGIGVDNIDVEAATRRGLAVVNAPGFCIREVAEHTLMFVLACARKLHRLNAGMHRGEWGRDVAAPLHGVYTQTLGLVGFGQIGREVARRAAAFGMTLLAADPYLRPADAERHGVRLVQLPELLRQADFVSVHAPLTAETRHLIGANELQRMKPTAYLINTSRGPLVDEAALAAALQQGRIAGAALDVFETEPLPASSPLARLDTVLLTPHTGGVSDESQEVARRTIARAAADILRGTLPDGPELCNRAVGDMPDARWRGR